RVSHASTSIRVTTSNSSAPSLFGFRLVEVGVQRSTRGVRAGSIERDDEVYAYVASSHGSDTVQGRIATKSDERSLSGRDRRGVARHRTKGSVEQESVEERLYPARPTPGPRDAVVGIEIGLATP